MADTIQVEVKVVGMVGYDFLAVAELVTLPTGASAADALDALPATGAIEPEAFEWLRPIPPPFFPVT